MPRRLCFRSSSKVRRNLRRRAHKSCAAWIERLESRVLLSAVIGNNLSVGNQLRDYRLAIAATAEYTAFHGGQSAALAAIETFVADLNNLYEVELAVHFDLVSDTNVIYTDAGTDPYTNGDLSAMLDENQTNLDSVIGDADYDIGHVFGTQDSGGSGLGGAGRRQPERFQSPGSNGFLRTGWRRLVAESGRA